MPYDPSDPEAKYKNATESLSDAEITRLAQATDASGKFQDLTSTRSRAGAQYMLEQGQLEDPGVTSADKKVDLAQLDKDYATKIDALVGKVPMSGDLEQISTQFGLSQREIVEIRRRQAGGITGAEGVAGEKEKSSFSERSSLGAGSTEKGISSYSYWDASRGVQVYAPQGKHFELLPGGGVRTVDGLVEGTEKFDDPNTGKIAGASTSSLFNQGVAGGKPVEGFKEEQLGVTPAEGKTVKRTGQSLFNPLTGVDVNAGQDEIVIEYDDGTFEIRKHGAIQEAGEARPVTEAGKTAEELGITRQTEIKGEGGKITRAPQTAAEALSAAQTPEEMDKVIQQEGLMSTAQMKFLGTDYTNEEGIPRTARPGNAFYQAPDGTILERPVALQSIAKQATGAPVDAGAVLSQNGVNFDPQEFGANPFQNVVGMYQQLLGSMGVGTAASAKAAYEAELKEIDKRYADQRASIDENPWHSESMRKRKHDALDSKYQVERGQVVARAELALQFDTIARQDAQFILGAAMQQFNADRSFGLDQQQFAFQQGNEMFNRQIQLENLSLNKQQQQQAIQEFEMQHGLQQAQFEQGVSEFNQQFGLSVAREARVGGSRSSGSGGTTPSQAKANQSKNKLSATVLNKYKLPTNTSPTEYNIVLDMLNQFGDLGWGATANALTNRGLDATKWDELLWETFTGKTRTASLASSQKSSGSGFSGL